MGGIFFIDGERNRKVGSGTRTRQAVLLIVRSSRNSDDFSFRVLQPSYPKEGRYLFRLLGTNASSLYKEDNKTPWNEALPREVRL